MQYAGQEGLIEGAQFVNTDDMMDEIRESWEDIDNNIIFKLFSSIPKRLLAVMDAHGSKRRH